MATKNKLGQASRALRPENPRTLKSVSRKLDRAIEILLEARDEWEGEASFPFGLKEILIARTEGLASSRWLIAKRLEYLKNEPKSAGKPAK